MPIEIDDDELRELFNNRGRISDENLDYYLENEPSLREQYGGKIIAVAGGSVVDSIEVTDDTEAVQGFLDRIRTEYDGAYITEVPDPEATLMY